MKTEREKKIVISKTPTKDELAALQACSDLLYDIYAERDRYSVAGKETDKELIFEFENEFGGVTHRVNAESLKTAYYTVFFLAWYCHKIVFPGEFAKEYEIVTEEEGKNEN